MKARKKAGVGASASAKGVLRVTESGNGKQMSVVVDVGQHPSRIRRFDGDDFGCGDAAWFAASTDAVPAFKEFLLREDTGASRLDRVSLDFRTRSYICLRQNRWTGLRFAVIMARLANGQLRAMSFHPRRLPKLQRDRSRSSSGAGDEELVKRAILFARGAAFCQWREQQKQAMESTPSSQQHELGGERGLKHPSALVGFDKGDKVDCRCGKNRSRGQMVTCEVCSTREHLECVDSSSQIAADYICSACLRAQKEEVFVISMDEQEEGRLLLNSGDSWTNTPKARDAGDESVCSLCGCEDNEDFETLIQPCTCTCDGAAVSAHPSCVSLALEILTQKDRSKQLHTCHACGSAKPPAPKRSSKRAPVTDTSNSTKCVKRLRSALAHPGKTEADESVHTGKSYETQEKVDAEARKPEASLLGGRFSNAASTVPIKKRRIQIMDSVRSPSPPSRSPSPSIKVNRDEFSYGMLESDKVVDERLPKCTQNKVEEEEEPGLQDYELSKDEDYDRVGREADGDDMRKDVDSGDSHGKRSHWDLNKGMDAWERPCEDGPDYSVDPAAEKSQEMAGDVTENAASDTDMENEASTRERTAEELCATSMQSTEEKNESDSIRDEGNSADDQAARQQEQGPVFSSSVVDNDQPQAEDIIDQTQAEDIIGDTKDDPKTSEDPGPKETSETDDKEAFQEDDTFEEEEDPDADLPGKVRGEAEEAEKVEEGQITADEWAEEACEAEHVDYDDSEEGDEPAEAGDERVARAEADYEGEQGEIHEFEAKRESDNEHKEGPSSGDHESCETKEEEHQPAAASCDEEAKAEKNAGTTRRVKASGWDQLPEGFDTAEEALRASKELFRRGVRPNAWTGNRLRPPTGSRVSQFESYERFRHEDPAWSRHEHHDQRNDMYDSSERFYSRDFGRGRSRGGAPSSPLVPRRAEPWMNGSVVPPGQWGAPKHHLSPPGRFSEGGGGFAPHGQANAAAVAAAKVESSGFVVAPDGTITKAGSPGAVARGGGRPFPAAGRNPPPLILNPTRPADPEAMAPPGRGIGLSPAMRVGPGMGMVGVSPGLRSTRGVFDRSYAMEGPAGMRGPPDGSRGGGYVDPERWEHRRERSPSIRRRSRSRSRSDSPPRKALRSPLIYAGSARDMSPASSVPKLPLPPPPPRGQRSPPAGLKRLSDRRDERRFFELDYHQQQQQQQHCLDSHREPRTSGWDLGPGDVGRISSGRFDELERNHDRRRRDRGFSSSSSGRPGRDGEEEVAPRRRRPPS